MPPVGVSVSSKLEKQKLLRGRAVNPGSGRYLRITAGGVQTPTASVMGANAEPGTLMERVLAPANLKCAYQRVVSNKGAPAADGMTVDELTG